MKIGYAEGNKSLFKDGVKQICEYSKTANKLAKSNQYLELFKAKKKLKVNLRTLKLVEVYE